MPLIEFPVMVTLVVASKPAKIPSVLSLAEEDSVEMVLFVTETVPPYLILIPQSGLVAVERLLIVFPMIDFEAETENSQIPLTLLLLLDNPVTLLF